MLMLMLTFRHSRLIFGENRRPNSTTSNEPHLRPALPGSSTQQLSHMSIQMSQPGRPPTEPDKYPHHSRVTAGTKCRMRRTVIDFKSYRLNRTNAETLHPRFQSNRDGVLSI